MALLQSNQNLEVGQRAPDFNLKGIDTKSHSLKDYKGKAFLIVFMCNHCPYVIPKIDALNDLHNKFHKKGLIIIGINSNDADNYPEDSFSKMQEYAKEWKINFDYLFDESQSIARAYCAVCTPDPFLLNEKKELVWHGRINDAMGPYDEVTSTDMEKAIAQLFETGKLSLPFLPSQGCSIKWR